MSPPTREMNEVRALITSELAVGAPIEEIEAFLQQHVDEYLWSEHSNRYEGVIRDVRPYYSIDVLIYLDNKREFVRSEVDYYYYGSP